MALRGTLTVPGDKSITHRAIILGALPDGESVISNYCPGEDCLHTARAFRLGMMPRDQMPLHQKLALERPRLRQRNIKIFITNARTVDCRYDQRLNIITILLAALYQKIVTP